MSVLELADNEQVKGAWLTDDETGLSVAITIEKGRRFASISISDSKANRTENGYEVAIAVEKGVAYIQCVDNGETIVRRLSDILKLVPPSQT